MKPSDNDQLETSEIATKEERSGDTTNLCYAFMHFM